MWKISYILNRFAKNLRFLSKLLELWNYQLFQFTLHWNGSPNNQSFEQAIWFMKFSSISLHFLDSKPLSRFRDHFVFLWKIFELWNLKYVNSFYILYRFAKSLSFFCKLLELWHIPTGFLDKVSFRKVKF